MHRAGGPWSAYRHSSRQPWLVQKRTAIFPRKKDQRWTKLVNPNPPKYPSFEVPPVLLDLDAENSPYVRQFAREDSQYQSRVWGQNREVEAVADRMDRFQEELAETDATLSSRPDGPSPWNVLARDILSVALFRAPAAADIEMARSKGVLSQNPPGLERPGEDANSEMGQVLRQNAVPARVCWDDTSTLQYLLHSRWQQLKTGLAPDATVAFRACLESCKDLLEVRRLVTSVLDVDGGPKLVTGCGGSVVSAMERLRSDGKASRQTDLELLRLLNNTTIRLSNSKMEIGPEICQYGLRLASNAGQIGAISMYMRIALELGHLDGSPGSAEGAVSNLLSWLLQSTSLDGTSQEPRSRLEVFSLLTGSSLLHKTGSPSVRAAIGGLPEYRAAYNSYVLLLGELGGLRSLWHEWNNSTTFESPSKHMSQSNRHRMFAVALQRMATRLKSRGVSASTGGYNDATGDYLEDTRLDLQSIRSLERHCHALERAAPTAKTSLPSPPVSQSTADRKEFLAEVEAALSSPDASAALAHLVTLVST